MIELVLENEDISRPDDIQIQFPFRTSQSDISRASLELNELNLMKNFKLVRTEEDIMESMSAYPVTITNRDVYSLRSRNQITGAILEFGISW